MTHRGFVPLALLLLTFLNWAELLMTEEAPQVTGVVTGQKYCLGQPTGMSLEKVPRDAITLMFQLQLSYHPGAEPIIVPSLASPTIVLSRSLNDANRRTNQMTIRPKFGRSFGDLEERGIDISFPNKAFFQVIRPGREVHPWVTESLAFRVHDPSDTQSKMELLGKKVFVQVELDHLVIPQELAQKLRMRWSSIGTLWTGTVRTQPVEFDIPLSPKTTVCPSQIRVD